MEPALMDDQHISLDRIDEAMFFRDAPGPAPAQIVFKGFRFADADEGVFARVSQQRLDARPDAGIDFFPVIEVFRTVLGEADDPTQSMALSTSLPCLA